MQVILAQNIKNLGSKGEIKAVADGYARNFLLPNGLVLVANKVNLEKAKQWAAEEEKRKAEEKEGAESLKAKLESTVIKLNYKLKNKEGELYGSVAGAEIAAALKGQGIEASKSYFDVKKPIKKLGEHRLTAKLPYDLTSEIKIIIEEE